MGSVQLGAPCKGAKKLPGRPPCLCQQGSISDEKVISPEDYQKLARSNYLSGKQAYHNQLAKTRLATEFAAPIPPSRPATGRGADYDPDSAYAQLAREQYAASKQAYKDQMAKTRRQTQFGAQVKDIPSPRLSSEDFAKQATSNYLRSKKAYFDMLNKQ